jgi:hypothetical protein
MDILKYLCLTCLLLAACSSTRPVEDEELSTFVETFATCAQTYRMYSDDPEMLADELSQVKFPENWQGLVDSLTARYDGDVAFWSLTFRDIADRSRR